MTKQRTPMGPILLDTTCYLFIIPRVTFSQRGPFQRLVEAPCVHSSQPGRVLPLANAGGGCGIGGLS